jgi:formylglycine-generating enzyme required for sulfatase activity
MAGNDLEQIYPFERDWSWPRETISWEEAAAFCARRRARLPSEGEWEYAARGPDSLIYPWGNEFDPMDVNWHSGHPYATGVKHEWKSWVGAYDMAGGIAEWVDGWLVPYGSQEIGGLRVARGGHWFSRAAYFWRAAARLALEPDYLSSTVGFRCAMDFEVAN